jgi:Protein of unknown function (DUF3326)
VRIINALVRLPSSDRPWLERLSAALSAEAQRDRFPIRAAICRATGNEALVECTLVESTQNDTYSDRLRAGAQRPALRQTRSVRPFAVVQIIPTGVRCEIGGFAGDACPATNLLASAADVLITHPNAVNASDLNEMAANVLYVEGRSLDDFMLGHLALAPVRANRIGTFVDPSGIEFLDDVVHALNAARAAGGIDCALYTVVAAPMGVRIEWSRSGSAVGTIELPRPLLEAVEHLLADGAQAIGGVSVIHGVTASEFSRHLGGEIPNPSGGVEAIITHLISKVFQVPAAHAPLPYYQSVKERSTRNPRASAEFISTPHYVSVLKGLARAPRLVPLENLTQVPADLVSLNNIGALVVPATCLGGIPALAADWSGIPIITVEENHTILDVTNERMQLRNVIPVRSYLEAAGAVLALRAGLSIESLRRPLADALRLEP